jgi:hypothetical protein
MTDLSMRPTWDVVDCALGPRSHTRSPERHRAERCREHYESRFSVDACPACERRRRAAEYSPLTHRSRVEVAVRLQIDAAVLRVISESVPSTLSALAERVSTIIGRRVLANNVSASLRRLREDGRTSVTIRPQYLPSRSKAAAEATDG